MRSHCIGTLVLYFAAVMVTSSSAQAQLDIVPELLYKEREEATGRLQEVMSGAGDVRDAMSRLEELPAARRDLLRQKFEELRLRSSMIGGNRH